MVLVLGRHDYRSLDWLDSGFLHIQHSDSEAALHCIRYM